MLYKRRANAFAPTKKFENVVNRSSRISDASRSAVWACFKAILELETHQYSKIVIHRAISPLIALGEALND